MIPSIDLHVDDETISTVGLKLSSNPLASISAYSRVFRYPDLEDVFIMETDLYGNSLPDDSCFLAFYGHHGLMGYELKLETLKNAKADEIKKIVESNIDG
jgi:hypothetical protein